MLGGGAGGIWSCFWGWRSGALLRLTHPTLDVLDGYGSCLGIEVRLVLGLG